MNKNKCDQLTSTYSERHFHSKKDIRIPLLRKIDVMDMLLHVQRKFLTLKNINSVQIFAFAYALCAQLEYSAGKRDTDSPI